MTTEFVYLDVYPNVKPELGERVLTIVKRSYLNEVRFQYVMATYDKVFEPDFYVDFEDFFGAVIAWKRLPEIDVPERFKETKR